MIKAIGSLVVIPLVIGWYFLRYPEDYRWVKANKRRIAVSLLVATPVAFVTREFVRIVVVPNIASSLSFEGWAGVAHLLSALPFLVALALFMATVQLIWFVMRPKSPVSPQPSQG